MIEQQEQHRVQGIVSVWQDKLSLEQEKSLFQDPYLFVRKIERGYLVFHGVEDENWQERNSLFLRQRSRPTELELEVIHDQTIH